MTFYFSPTNAAAAICPQTYSAWVSTPYKANRVMSSACSPADKHTMMFTAPEGSGDNLLNISALPNLKKISEIEKLEDNWNGYGARKFDSPVIRNAKRMLYALKQQPFVSPTARQSIQMEFEKENGDYFEIEVFAERIDVFLSIDSEEKEKSFPLEAAAIEKIARMVAQFNG